MYDMEIVSFSIIVKRQCYCRYPRSQLFRTNISLEQTQLHVYVLLPLLFIGKIKILTQLKSKDVRDIASIFADKSATQDDVGRAGCQLAIQR